MLEAGSVIGCRFEIVGLLGRGGMGEVYEARDRVKDLAVALKVLRPLRSSDPRAAERLLKKEVALAQRISHRNVCRINDPYVHLRPDGETSVALSMELLRGPTLAEVLALRGRVTAKEALPLAKQLAAGIDAAHEAGVFHRDLKPSNIMLVDQGEGIRVVITDFGLARVQPAGQSVADLSRGVARTLRYMAPEQLEGRAGFRSDLYAFSLILFELLTGELPFSGDSDLSIALSRLSTPPRDPGLLVDDLPLGWRVAILKGLSRAPRERFGSAQELIDTLEFPKRSRTLRWRFALLYPFRGRQRVTWAGLVLLALAGAVVTRLLRPPPHLFPPFSTILVDDLEHAPSTDKPLLGASLSFLASLSQSPHISVSSPSDFSDTLTRMGRPLTHLDILTLRQLALRTGQSAILLGSLSKGKEYTLRLRLEVMSGDPKRPSATDSRDFAARNETELFDAIAAAASWVRRLSGEGPHELIEQDARPEDLTTGSWEALSLLQQARLRRDVNQPAAALVFIKEALDEDSGFAAAESLRGDILTQLRRYGEAFAAHKRALDLAKKRNVTGRERYVIESRYNLDAGDDNASLDTYRSWIAHFPLDSLPRFFLAYHQYHRGNYGRALAEMQVYQQLRPSDYTAYPHLATYFLATGDVKGATKAAQTLKGIGAVGWATEVEGQILLANHQFDAASVKVRPLLDLKDDVFSSVGPWYVANALADGGRFEEAEDVLVAAASRDDQRGREAEQAERVVAISYLRWLRKDRKGAISILNPMIASLDNPDSLSLAGAILARCGQLTGARTVQAQLNQWPSVPLVDSAQARLRAEIALALGRTGVAYRVPGKEELFPSPLDLEFGLHAARSARRHERLARLALMALQRPDIVLSWEGWRSSPGLYWVASCLAQSTAGKGDCGAFSE
jgi:serine/threonine protein kinase/predicted negative regulator of RcsB-dependent stress response